MTQNIDLVHFLPQESSSYILSPTINPQPLISNHLKLNYPSLLDVSDLKLQQALIINDLFFVLIGLEGNYIRYSNTFAQTQSVNYHTENAYNNDKNHHLATQLSGPDFKISKNLNPSLKDLTKNIIKLGKIFYALRNFKGFFDNNSFGKINQSFAGFIRDTIKEYLANLNSIYLEYQNNPNYSILLMGDDLKRNNTDLKLKLLYEICHLIYNDTKKRVSQNNDFINFINNLKKDFYSNNELDLNSDNSKLPICKGGLILKIISQQIQRNQGNNDILQFLHHLFNEVSQNYLLMLNTWLVNGIVDDPFNEFLIKLNLSEVHQNQHLQITTDLQNLAAARFNSQSLQLLLMDHASPMERYWDSKFSIRRDGLPRQLEEFSLRNKVLLTGTYLNIIKDCGIMVQYTDFNSQLFREQSYYIRDLTDINLLNLQVNYWYIKANNMIMNLFYSGYNFLAILQDFKKFFFLNDNSMMAYLVRCNLELLKKPHHSSYLNELKNDFSFYFTNDKDFDSYSDEESSTNQLLLKLGEVTMERNGIFTELEDILNVKPINPEGIFNSSSYQALKNIVNEAIVPTASHQAAAATAPTEDQAKHVSFNDYLIHYINFDIILPFPLNLMISQTEIIKFQLIFRFLLLNVFFMQLFDESFLDLKQFKIESNNKFYSKKISKLSVLNFKILSLLKRLYTSYQLVIDANFNNSFEKLAKFKQNRQEAESVPKAANTNINTSTNNNFSNNLRRSNSIFSQFDSDFNQQPNTSTSSMNFNANVKTSAADTLTANVNNKDDTSKDNLTFEESKKKIQDMLDNILLYLYLTNFDYLKLIKSFFRVLINFNKFVKRFLKEVGIHQQSKKRRQGYSFTNSNNNMEVDNEMQDGEGSQVSMGSKNTAGGNAATMMMTTKVLLEFNHYYKKFEKEYELHERKLAKFWEYE